MTYCVGMLIDDGIVFMSDTRTNAGYDNIAKARKIYNWSKSSDRQITLLSAGNLATTQKVITSISSDNEKDSIYSMKTMEEIADHIGDVLQKIIQKYSNSGQSSESTFSASFILGGQIKDEPMRLFQIYPEGNFIEASADSPFFQIGEIKYGRPIILRGYEPTLSFSEALKLLLVSFDSTLKANVTVGLPFDFQCYKKDSLNAGNISRIYETNEYYQKISNNWGDALKEALDRLPDFPCDNANKNKI